MQNGDRVQWQEGGAKQFTCTGTIICEDQYQNGTNPLGFYTIRVDEASYPIACHTASEMSRAWVSRSIKLSNLRPIEVNTA